jgi:hypothetical protein
VKLSLLQKQIQETEQDATLANVSGSIDETVAQETARKLDVTNNLLVMQMNLLLYESNKCPLLNHPLSLDRWAYSAAMCSVKSRNRLSR